jgi:hypothetical protein
MHESSTYQMIVEEGELKEVKKLLSLLGEDRFGPPSEEIKTALANIEDLERLERMVRRVIAASNWQDLLQVP